MFDEADEYDLSDGDGNLYNVSRDDDGEYRIIGRCQEQLARFWNAPSDAAWHGFPFWSIHTAERTTRGDQRRRPARSVLEKFVRQGILSAGKAVRLRNGDVI